MTDFEHTPPEIPQSAEINASRGPGFGKYPEGRLDLDRARPLMMTGSKKGMHYCTASEIDRADPFGAMFPDGRDPLAAAYDPGTKQT